MIDTRLGLPAQKKYLRPLLLFLEQAGISPLTLTLLATLSGLLIIPAQLYSPFLALALLFLTGALDFIDGALARHLGSASAQGAVADIVSDRLVEFAIVLSLYLLDPSRALLCLLMLGAILICITSFLVVGIFLNNDSHKSFHYSPGLMERSEAFGFFALMILFPQSFTLLASLFTLLVAQTAFYRVYQFTISNKTN